MTALAVAVIATETPCHTSQTPDDWFAHPGSRRALTAKTACLQDCPLYFACADYALDQGIPHGVWGGLDGKDRKAVWAGRRGGRPAHFDQAIDDALRPLFDARKQLEAGGDAVAGASEDAARREGRNRRARDQVRRLRADRRQVVVAAGRVA